MALLRAAFNALALNLAVLLACLPLITVPAGLQAGMVALEQWRSHGEDRVVREFLTALRPALSLRATVAVGLPLSAAALGAEEVRFFSMRSSPIDLLCLAMGAATTMLALTCTSSLLVIGAWRAELGIGEQWYLSLGVAVRNLWWSGPLVSFAWLATASLVFLDPPLALIGLLVGLLFVLDLIASRALRQQREPAGR